MAPPGVGDVVEALDPRARSPGDGGGWYLVGADSSSNDAPQAGQASALSITGLEQEGQVVIAMMWVVHFLFQSFL
jgi:hypothetical protein